MSKLLLFLTAICAYTASANANTFTITNLNDAGIGSLRQAIIDANVENARDTITFSVAGEIILKSDLPQIKTSVDIKHDIKTPIVINGNNKQYDPFIFDGANVVASIDGIAIVQVKTAGIRIRNQSTVTVNAVNISESGSCGIFVRNANAIIQNSQMTNNQVDGIFAFGKVVINNVICNGNECGILVHRNGNVIITNSTFANNTSAGIMFDGNGVAANITCTNNKNGIAVYDGEDGMHGADVHATVYNSISYDNTEKDLYNIDGDELIFFNTVYETNDGATITNCITDNPNLSTYVGDIYGINEGSSAINLADKNLITIANLTQYAADGDFIEQTITQDYIDSILNYDQLYRQRGFNENKYDAGGVAYSTSEIDNKNENNFIILYPNPSNEQITISTASTIMNNISLFDANGKLLQVYENIDNVTYMLDISKLSAGVYVLNIDGKAVKIIKK